MENFLKPTKSKIILALGLFFVYFIFSALNGPGCNALQIICPSGENAMSVPLTCSQVCTQAEYNSQLIKAVSLDFIVPVLISYIIASLIIFFYLKIRKK
ncbi:hypothetical protein GW931_02865 [archaeon]|nr:hypothetical protein [archaeon]